MFISVLPPFLVLLVLFLFLACIFLFPCLFILLLHLPLFFFLNFVCVMFAFSFSSLSVRFSLCLLLYLFLNIICLGFYLFFPVLWPSVPFLSCFAGGHYQHPNCVLGLNSWTLRLLIITGIPVYEPHVIPYLMTSFWFRKQGAEDGPGLSWGEVAACNVE